VRTDLARPDALTLTLTLTLAPRVARSLDRFYRATAFNQDLSGWNVANVVTSYSCLFFCANAGFTEPPTIPSFPGSCGDPGC
jgi:hypothetical protein